MNNPESKLKDLIQVNQSIIPSFVCDYIIEQIENKDWRTHKWYNPGENQFESDEEKNHDILNATPDVQGMLTPVICEVLNDYNLKNRFNCKKTEITTSTFSNVIFNRYSPGQLLDQHQDHINALFDGQKKGIPVLSMILSLNDDYEGGELFFWDDYVVPLGKGDIIMFPSLFLFPHGVKEATKGKRYSAVSWAW